MTTNCEDALAFLHQAFTDDGDCPTLGDPYRERNPMIDALFTEDGYLRDEAIGPLRAIAARFTTKPFSDVVVLLIADRFARNTKGNYSTIYYWR
jgi:hypothetical protein